jgi:hypothetical protein
MPHPLAQLADLGGWLRWFLIAVAVAPVAVLALIVIGGLFGWVRDPKRMWTKQE